MTLPNQINAGPVLELAHHRIHEGNHFMVHKIITNIDIINPKYFLIIPPPIPADPNNTIEIHLIFEVYTDKVGTLALFEDPEITDNGTAITIINNNRRSSTTSLTEVYYGPTVTLPISGLLLFEERGTEIGEMDRDDEEMILHPSKKYVFRFTASTDDTAITMELNWYDNRPSTVT